MLIFGPGIGSYCPGIGFFVRGSEVFGPGFQRHTHTEKIVPGINTAQSAAQSLGVQFTPFFWDSVHSVLPHGLN